MTKELFDKIINTLKNNSFEIKFECNIFSGKTQIRGIYIYNTSNKNSIKKLFDKEILKNVNIQNTLTWYLGERKKIILLKFNEEIELDIPEVEKYNIINSV